MNVSYKGIKKEIPAKLQEKLDAKFAKLSKLLEQKGPKEAHVIVTQERHLNKAEVTMQFYGHPLVGASADADLFTAVSGALLKLEAQAVKQTAKWREKNRRSAAGSKSPAKKAGPELAAVVTSSDNGKSSLTQRIYRVKNGQDQKPMTLDEAILEMELDRDYMVYRDAERNGLSVLVRRRDGHFDLIEA
jgi:putative sigma-54 modulation protein